jgi:pyruvate,water dikinase
VYDLVTGWATGCEARGVSYWPPIVARRKEILERLREAPPAPALGVPPEEITEPITIMLWGVTPEMIEEWLGDDAGEGETTELRGVAASPGVARGRARVVKTPEDLHDVQTGDILVCRITAPSWAPVFSRLGAAVSDIGGIMAHTAIVSREYGLPAVDGSNGVVRVLQDEV